MKKYIVNNMKLAIPNLEAKFVFNLIKKIFHRKEIGISNRTFERWINK